MGLLFRIRRRLGLFRVVDGLAENRDPYVALFTAANVRVRVTPETEEAGWAGAVGPICGETTPSLSEVEVVGATDEDYAINVWSDEHQDQAWFAPHLLEVAD